MKRIFIIATLIVGNLVFGQETSPPKETLPPTETKEQSSQSSPTLRTMSTSNESDSKYLGGTRGNKVSTQDGMVNVNIPIYTIQTPNINYPIGILYKSGGIKVNQSSSEVGLGWKLYGVGKITRIVKDLPDEQNENGGKPVRRDINYFRTNISRINSEIEKSYEFDTEPDEYRLELGDIDVTFYRYEQTPLSNIKINREHNEDGSIKYWWVRDAIGNTYYFGENNAIASTSNNGRNAVSDWYLNKITTKYNRTIDFEYTPGYTRMKQEYIKNEFIKAQPNGTIKNDSQNDPLEKNERSLSKIKYLDLEVAFEYDKNERLDEYRAYNTLKSIVIKRGHHQLRKILFQQDYFKSDDGYKHPGISDKYRKRLKLKELQVFEGGENKSHNYIFEYNETVNLPPRYSYAQDSWGHFNGKNNSSLIPKIDRYLIDNSKREYIGSADRSISPTHAEANILKKVRYPNGSYSFFRYETHSASRVFNEHLPQNSSDPNTPIGGLRVKEHNTYNLDNQLAFSEVYDYTKTLTNGIKVSSGLTYTYPNFVEKYYLDNNKNSFIVSQSSVLSGTSSNPIFYDVITKSIVDSRGNSNGKTEYHYAINYDNPPREILGNYLVDKSQMQSDWNIQLLESEKTYDSSNNLIEEITYNYSSRNKKKIDDFGLIIEDRGTIPNKFARYQFYPLITEFHFLESMVSRTYFKSGKTIETKDIFSYNNPNHLQLTLEKSILPDGSIEETHYEYAYEKGHQKLISENFLGVPFSVEKKVKNNELDTGKIVSKMEILYETPAGNDFFHPSKLLSYDVENISISTVDVSYDKYDHYGNLLQYTSKSKPTSILWGYNYSLPIVVMEGITYGELIGKTWNVTRSSDLVNQGFYNESNLLIELDKFRQDPLFKDLKITSYTYHIATGQISTITKDDGIREKRIYNNEYRLASIMDSDENLIQEYKYNNPYTTTPPPPPPIVYYNAQMSKTFWRSTCVTPPNDYTYTVPAKKYSAYSQAEANAKAQVDIDQNGQNHADLYGTCQDLAPLPCYDSWGYIIPCNDFECDGMIGLPSINNPDRCLQPWNPDPTYPGNIW